jgi:hypothetical protein
VLKGLDVGALTDAVGTTTVDYGAVNAFLIEAVLPFVAARLAWDRPVYTKYRVSDGNNSVDASTLHRDVIVKSDRLPVPLPLFTVLVYVDASDLELIPGSHRTPALPYDDTLTCFDARARLHVDAGDVVVFYATLLHRGIFTTRQPRRRLLQVFDTFPTAAVAASIAPQIVHVPGRESHDGILTWAARRGTVIEPMNLVGYLNAATGYGGLASRLDCDDAAIYSSEGKRGRWHPTPSDVVGPINKYVYNPRTAAMQRQLTAPACRRMFDWKFYNRQYGVYAGVVLGYLLVLVVLAVAVGKRWQRRRSLR